MFAYFKGRIDQVMKEHMVLDVNDVGYMISMTDGDIQKLIGKINEVVKVHIYTDIKENDISLYGFLDRESLSVFEKLKKVSGIGSRTAKGILSYMTPQDICIAIANEEVNLLNQVPGVGAKTAARIILELKDKILKEDISTIEKAAKVKIKTSTSENEAILALKVLGYTQNQINEALSGIDVEGLTVEQVIKRVLSGMNKI